MGRKPKISIEEAEYIRDRYHSRDSNAPGVSQLAHMFRVSQATIFSVVNRRGPYAQPTEKGKNHGRTSRTS